MELNPRSFLILALRASRTAVRAGRVRSGIANAPRARYVFCLPKCSMQQTGGSTLSPQKPSSDIIFACTHCSASFVVDSAAAGMTLNCQKCGKPTTVPNHALEAAAGNSIKISDVQHQLKENESQRIEITGYINQLSIQLHRWQLRLQTLKERQEKLQAELATICGPTAS